MAIDHALVNRSRDHKDYPRAKEIAAELISLHSQIDSIEARIKALESEQNLLDPHAVGVIDYDLYGKQK